MMAGLIAAILFVIAQWASNPAVKELGQALPPGLSLLVPFELVIGFIAGLTLEMVFTNLQGADIVNVNPVTVKKP
jgi:flagellar biosynthesis protein FliR